MRRYLLIALALVAATWTLPAGAEEQPRAVKVEMPSAVAMEVMRGEGTVVQTPRSPGDVASALASFIDGEGNLQTGVALEVSPSALGFGQDMSYLRDYGTRFFSRASFSLATAALLDAKGDPAVGLGMGLRTVLWDDGDPLMHPSYERCASSEATEPARKACREDFDRRCAADHPDDLIGQEECLAALEQNEMGMCLQSAYRACVMADGALLIEDWGGSGGALGVATSMRFLKGRWDQVTAGPFGGWFSWASPRFLEYFQVQGTLGFHWDHELDDIGVSNALRIRWGSPNFRGYIDGGWEGTLTEFSKTNTMRHGVTVGVGIEVKIFGEGWTSIGFGTTFDPEDADAQKIMALGNLTWGLSPTVPEPDYYDEE